MHTNWIIVAVIISAVYLPALYFGMGKRVNPIARRVLLILTGIEICLVFFHLFRFAYDMPPVLQWYFDLGSEFALGATYSAIQLLAIGLLALTIAVRAPFKTLWHRLYWLFLAALFITLNFDEYYAFHETLDELLFVIVAVISISVILFGFWLGFRDSYLLFFLMMGGFVIMGIAIVSDKFLPFVPQQSALEEFMEMNGATWVLIGFLHYAYRALAKDSWKHTIKILLFGSIIWLIVLQFQFWVAPTLEYLTLANRVQIEYIDGDLALIGYRLNKTSAEPGDTIQLTLYWQAKQPIREPHGVSAHLLSHPDIQSITQSNHKLIEHYGTDSWIPGIIMRVSIPLPIPDDVITPASYWLQISTWKARGFIPIDVSTYSQGWLLNSDTLVFLSVPILDDVDPVTLPVVSAYQFGDKFSLTGYDLPGQVNSHEPFSIRLNWQVGDKEVGEDYTQFIHFFAGETFAFGIDQQPFAGRFPTQDWVANRTFTDTIVFPNTENLPVGEYTVFTGMYDSETQERVPIMLDNMPVENNLINLGTLVVQ